MDTASTPGAPLFSLTFWNASHTARFEISKGLSDDFSSSTRLLPAQKAWLIERTTATDDPAPWLHSHYRRFTATTGRSAGKTRNGTQGPSRYPPLRTLPLAARPRARSIGSCLLTFHAEAADQARVASMPGTTWPVGGLPPGSSQDQMDTLVSIPPVTISTRQQRFTCARLPDPHLTRPARLFHIAHHDPVTGHAACGGLKPPPAGRLRRATPSSPAQHRLTKLYLHQAPFRVRDAPTCRTRRWTLPPTHTSSRSGNGPSHRR